jgi:hypothetical protein
MRITKIVAPVAKGGGKPAAVNTLCHTPLWIVARFASPPGTKEHEI